MNLPRVLVIDDSTSICLLISTALQKAGYQVEVALNGRDGMAKLLLFRPHCLILDVLLPDISGYALCRQLRQNPRTQQLPLILISSKNAALDMSYGLRQGADRYLSKPFTAEALIQNVWEVVPEPLRAITQPALPAVQPQRTSAAFLRLIPRRTLSQDAMQTRNPLASTPAIKDKQARLLFSKIDGKNTVTRLAALTGLGVEEVERALRVLLTENSISFYNEAGQRVDAQL